MTVRKPSWLNRFEHDLPSIIGLAKKGDVGKASSVLAYFCDCYERNEAPKQIAVEYVITCLKGIVDGMDAKEALNLKRKRGQKKSPSASTRETREEIGLEISNLISSGKRKFEATVEVAEKFGIPEDTALEYYKNVRKDRNLPKNKYKN